MKLGKIALLMLAVGVTGCSGAKSTAPVMNLAQTPTSTATGSGGGGLNAPPATDPAIAAYQKGFYAFAIQQGCVECHSTTASLEVVHPTFADTDVKVAYQAAKGMQIGSATNPLISFSNPSGSIFVQQTGNSHCGETPCQDAAAEPTVVGLLQAWAAAEIAEYPSEGIAAGPSFQTPTLAIPAVLPLVSASVPAVMRFPLGGVVAGDSSLANAILEVSIELYSAGGNEYRIFNPRIIGNTAVVNLNGIHIYIRPASGSGVGTIDAYQGDLWGNLSMSAAILALPKTLPAGPMTTAVPLTLVVASAAVQSTADVMTIGFNSIQ